MAEESRYRTVIEFAGDDTPIEPVLQRLEQRMQALVDRAQGVLGGGASGGSMGGAGGMPVAPPAPASPAALPGGGGGMALPPATGGAQGAGGGAVPLPGAPMSPATWTPPPSPAAPGGAPYGGSQAYENYWAGMDADRIARNERRDEQNAIRRGMRPGALEDVVTSAHAAANGVMGANPGALYMGAAALGGSYFSRKADEYRDRGETGTARLLSTAGTAIPFLGAVAAGGLAMRYAIAQRKSEVDLAMAQAELGGVDVDLERAAAVGYGPGEAASMAQTVANVGGHRAAGGFAGVNSIYKLARVGVSPSTVGEYAAQFAPGGVGYGTGGVTQMARHAFGVGLVGSGVERWLQTIAAHTARLAENGLSVNLDQTADFIARIRATGELSDIGKRLPDVVTGIDSARISAADQMFGKGFGILEMASTYDALQADSPMGMLRRFENQTPETLMRTGVELAGREMTAIEIARKVGIPIDLAYELTGPLAEKGKKGSIPAVRGTEISSAMARAENDRLSTMSTDEAVGLVSTVESFKDVLNGAGKGIQGFGDTVVETAKQIKKAFRDMGEGRTRRSPRGDKFL